MKVYEHIQRFTIKYCDCDFKDEMKPSIALALMEEVACSSADELGFGYAYVFPRGYAFMVTNVCMEFLRPVALGQSICLKTWPLPPTRATFGREYQFLTEEGAVSINASSRWCLVDMHTGRLLQSKVIDNQDYSTYNTRRVFEEVVWKIPSFQPEEGELCYAMTVASSDYDHNMHVNNTRYADYCMNCFTIAELTSKRIKKFSISYIKQCKEKDELRFYRKPTEDGGYFVQGFNANRETVVQALIYFEG
jgi:acyl-ACP thioesterase